MVEIKLNQIIARKPHLINQLNRNVLYPFIRKYCHMPFNFYSMNVTNSFDYDIITDYDNFTNDYNFTNNYTNNEKNIDVFIPTLLFTRPCGLSFFCLISLMVYTLIKPFLNNKKWRTF